MTKKCLDLFDTPFPSPKQMMKERKGVAMLLVLVTITMMSAIVVEFSYQTRIDLALAVNQRDKVKSEYLARSAVNIARLMLGFQFALQTESDKTESKMGQTINVAMQRSNFQLYQYIDLMMGIFNSGKIESPVGGVNLTDAGVEGFGDFTGDMEAKVIPEDGRINLNSLAKTNIDPDDLSAFCSLFLNKEYDKLFERKDPVTGETLDRGTMLSRIVDFIDLDNQRTIVTPDCKLQKAGGDEDRLYAKYEDRDKVKVRPKNAKLSHVAELRQVPGVDDLFFNTFKDNFTVYPVGKPNINVANSAVFYSILCQNVELDKAANTNNAGSNGNAAAANTSGISLCSTNPVVASQVFWIALALDGIRTFFENPMTVLLGYIGSTESRLLPSAKKGQPVAFVYPSQLPGFISDLQADPMLMAKFLLYSPSYAQLIKANPSLAIDPLNPVFPKWTISFNNSGLIRSVSTDTPKIYRIVGTGRYGSTETTIEAVVDYGRTLRRLPTDDELKDGDVDPDTLNDLIRKKEEMEADMPKGRFLYWHQE